ncbi:MAG: GxxExxY protein [Anaerolineales bacterium]
MSEREGLNKITEGIIGAAIEVHKNLGPGLLESAYQAALAYELTERGFKIEQQKSLPLLYKNIKLEAGYRLDFLVNDKVVVEIKSMEGLAPIHEAQLLSYLRLSNCKVGLLINFNVKLLKQGVKRLVNGSLD